MPHIPSQLRILRRFVTIEACLSCLRSCCHLFWAPTVKLPLHDDLLHVVGFLEQAVSVLSYQVFQSYFVSCFHKTQEDSPSLERVDNPPSTTRQGKVSQLVAKQTLRPVCPEVVTRAISTTYVLMHFLQSHLKSRPMSGFPFPQCLSTEPPTEMMVVTWKDSLLLYTLATPYPSAPEV